MKDRSAALKSGILLGLLFLCVFGMGMHNRAKAASNKTLVAGETIQLPAKGTYGFTSSRPAVASVSADGLVTALRKGTCRVTAVRNQKKRTWKITVLAPKLSKEQRSVGVNQSFSISLKNASGLQYNWAVSDPTVLRLKKKGEGGMEASPALRTGQSPAPRAGGRARGTSCAREIPFLERRFPGVSYPRSHP